MNHRRIGQSVLNFSQIGSTNDYASFLLSEGKAEDGMIITAVEQSTGRGQRGRVWYSVPGESLTFSLILTDCAIPVERAFLLQVLTAIGIRRWVSGILSEEPVFLKWPNDIIVKDKKLAGILTETQIQGGEVSSVVIGIGINLNQTGFPHDTGNPISLYMLCGVNTSPEEELKVICSCLRQVFGEWQSGQEANILREYSRFFYGKGELRYFTIGGRKVEAIPQGISETGSLVLRGKDGSIMQLDSATVEWH